MKRVIILAAIAAALLLLFGWMFTGYITSGYGGIASRINDVETDFPTAELITIAPGGTVADVRYSGVDGSIFSGQRMELGQPQYKGDDLKYSNHIEQETDDGVWIRDWEVRIAYFDLSFTITSDGGGILAMLPVDYWIELQENQFDVFTAADEVEAYILEVVTLEPVEINDPVNVKVTPSAGGFSFDLTSMSSEPIPNWMVDAGYQGVLSELKHVKFQVTANGIQPTQILHMRYENGATWTCEVRALVFGFWEVLSPYDEWEFKFYGWLDFLGDLAGLVSVIIGLVLGIVFTIVILKFIPDKRIAMIILLGIWFFIIYFFGFVELFT